MHSKVLLNVQDWINYIPSMLCVVDVYLTYSTSNKGRVTSYFWIVIVTRITRRSLAPSLLKLKIENLFCPQCGLTLGDCMGQKKSSKIHRYRTNNPLQKNWKMYVNRIGTCIDFFFNYRKIIARQLNFRFKLKKNWIKKVQKTINNC